ncbi:hypothetical protein SCLCIDRAFT_1208519 [Scleroderma citrinum Foug A]|uniref:Uncharacterized protein n=1 Tax=Scleroderma citrinum Foug A TaxID=1036808 RepID=A0A0C3A5Z8_9AGAM|nr:hypothetical protein SCLCIDRAFT_1208519 [Scleroderma citrinum Foug A]
MYWDLWPVDGTIRLPAQWERSTPDHIATNDSPHRLGHSFFSTSPAEMWSECTTHYARNISSQIL